MEKLEIYYLNVDDLTPYEHNTRQHGAEDVDKIAKSIEKYGFNDPIAVWGDKNIIVEGHGRLMAAKRLGMHDVPCIRLDTLTDDERREYAILHNWTAEQSEWDFSELEKEIADLDFDDFDLGFDFNTDEPDEDITEDEFDAEPPENPKSRQGDLFQLGRHRLLCGDSTKAEDVKRLMGGGES